ncbi:hypothetical protein PHYBLDRAFT_142275 [Phycomyces blakesleeanus NRRL 1555(-)]|uniref:Uncharacterized protein n=1 Tax=Phycomyces blakesleeanus (strain ATCC 8743b / DSM 1359 / FGSC 10004 / NBRC 33097 / NRRL 1555) TaxID=763407 RepID=A0A167NWP5_PHYB8|nr:hypothetical protein PHYBLDRAFT_142275 [Phycomyces blakesleeanus NRRL 1555(-)]OAD76768.1 hypothetical protein PHYBLDRAFT_142275 [Phycomyces blakesleeanus NRRL 1555(-)]|eukprot:XP_018294808.1 hypothetical protein PHYBLDRAFT_142275 [Phycomyces blakesleeanus NRRL 1555(-)]
MILGGGQRTARQWCLVLTRACGNQSSSGYNHIAVHQSLKSYHIWTLWLLNFSDTINQSVSWSVGQRLKAAYNQPGYLLILM